VRPACGEDVPVTLKIEAAPSLLVLLRPAPTDTGQVRTFAGSLGKPVARLLHSSREVG
jgi:hypothetical protein